MKKTISILFFFMLMNINIIFGQVIPIDFPPNKQYEITSYIDIGWVKGTVGVYYKTSFNTLDKGKITRPFIMVEGFDATGANKLDNKEGLYGTYAVMFNNLRADGWDVILLDLLNNNNKIEDNSQLMRKLITEINQEVKNNHDIFGTDIYRTTIMGYSMGGLICRNALCDIEGDQEEHKVDNMICWDSPHKGANIPLGYQGVIGDEFALTALLYANAPDWMQQITPVYWLNKLVTNKFGINLGAESAVQMSLNYPFQNTVRFKFLDQLDSKGSYPKDCRKIAIADGSNGISMAKPYWLDKNLMYWHGGLCLFDWSWGGFNMRFCPFGFGMDIYRMPGAIVPTAGVFYSGCGMDIGVTGASTWTGGFMLKTSINMDNINLPRYNGNIDVDLVPGSYIKSAVEGLAALKQKVDNNPLSTQGIPIKIQIKGGCLGRGFFRFCFPTLTIIDTKIPVQINLMGRVEYKPFTFVPTVSALDVRTDDMNLWYYDVSKIGRYPNGNQTPFDVVCYSDINRNHTDSYPRARMMVHDEISPQNLFIQNYNFKNNYVNTFQARNNIIIGNNVDNRADSLNPNQKRKDRGKVVAQKNSNITLVSGQNDFVYFDDGFETAADFTGEITTKTYFYDVDYQPEYNTNTHNVSIINDGYYENNQVVNNQYKISRQQIKAAKNASQMVNRVDVSKLPDPNLNKFDEKAADEKFMEELNKSKIHKLNSYLSANQESNLAILNFKLLNSSHVLVKIIDVNGVELMHINLGEFGVGVHEVKIDFSSLTTGHYLCQVITNEYVDIHKFGKQ